MPKNYLLQKICLNLPLDDQHRRRTTSLFLCHRIYSCVGSMDLFVPASKQSKSLQNSHVTPPENKNKIKINKIIVEHMF